MLRFALAALLMTFGSAPLVAECNCSPEKLEALRAKLREEGKSTEDVSCEAAEEDKLVCDECDKEEEQLIADCNCKKRSRGNA